MTPRETSRKGRLPTACPSCSSDLRVAQLACPDCTTAVHGDYRLPALSRLDGEDQQFALAFILGSGSLKEMARLYGVSYPTVRNRLDELIARLQRIREAQEEEAAATAAGVPATGGGGDDDGSGNDE